MLLFMTPASAALISDPDYYILYWTVGPAQLPQEPFWVREQGKVVETRLWPTELYRTTYEVRSADGRKLLPAGAQVARLHARLFIVCNLVDIQVQGYSGANKRDCLVDENGDAKLDSYFERGSGGGSWYDLSGKLPKKRLPLDRAPIERVDPKQFVGSPYLALHYERYLDKGNALQRVLEKKPLGGSVPELDNKIRFHFLIGREQKRDWFYRGCEDRTEPYTCADGVLPSSYMFFGMKIEILQRKGEDLLFKVDSNFEPQTVRILTLTDRFSPGGLVLIN
jgi:hypothetical protein